MRVSVAGLKLQVGTGTTAWNDHVSYVTNQISDSFLPFVWDVSSLNLQSITKFGIKILDNYVNPVSIWFDLLEVELAGHQTFKMDLTKSTYSLTPDKSEIQCEFGQLQTSLVQYIAGLQQASQNLKLVSQISNTPVFNYLKLSYIFKQNVAISNIVPIYTGSTAGRTYSAVTALPAGLSINSSSGIISGTPAALSVMSQYKIKVVNDFGQSFITLNFSVTATGY